MQANDFDFILPEHLIAQTPLPARDGSRLLHVPAQGNLQDRYIRDLAELARDGDVWVLNDTRVIPARLQGRKLSGGKVEILLLEPLTEAGVWLAWGKANKPLRPGTRILFADGFEAEILQRQGKNVHVRLLADDISAAIEIHGHTPLPPYIKRMDEQEDKTRYQTVFAKHNGAVAAPTAGLHLTQPLLDSLTAKGVTLAYVTLHVGPGTFQPMQVEHLEDHTMHEERYAVSAVAANQINTALNTGGRVVAVGTTALRTLEASFMDGAVQAGSGRTRLFIYPGYPFQAVHALLTNFHLPRSTLLMLVCAMASRNQVLAAYAHAVAAEYRFYSYGDAMFVEGIPKSQH